MGNSKKAPAEVGAFFILYRV